MIHCLDKTREELTKTLNEPDLGQPWLRTLCGRIDMKKFDMDNISIVTHFVQIDKERQCPKCAESPDLTVLLLRAM